MTSTSPVLPGATGQAIAVTPERAHLWDFVDAHGSVRALAVLRIALGPITLLHLRPFLRDAADGVAYDDHFWRPFVSWLPQPSGDAWFAMLWIGAAAAVLMTIGLWTRVAATVTFAVVAYNLVLSETHVRHNRVFLTILLGGIALLPTGRVLSVDAWWRTKLRRSQPPSELVALWPMMLLRAQVSLVYLASGFSKLVDPDWFGGLVLWDRVVRYQHVLDPTPLPAWAIDALTSRWLYYGVAPAAVATELFVGVGLWFHRTRLAAIWTALFFHVMIEVSASVEVFSLAAIAALAIWVTPSTRDRTVLIGDTTRAGWLAVVLRHADVFARFRVERAQPDARLTVVDRDGSCKTGTSAVLLVLSRIPFTFFVAAPIQALADRRRNRNAAPA